MTLPADKSSDKPTVFLSAAEASGDEHAAALIEAIRRRIPGARFVGVAGEKMAAAGCEVVADLTKRASMLGGPILRMPYYVRLVRRIQDVLRNLRPDIHVPVDSPAMNWHLAAATRDIGVPVVYYIAPQVWAWAPWRVRKLARLTDHVACILPFEQEYLRERGVRATYVGHPLFDSLDPPPEHMPDILDAWWTGRWRVALLPGSRPGEIRDHSPALMRAAAAIRKRWPGARCTFTVRSDADADLVRRTCFRKDLEIESGQTRRVLAQSHFALVVSGTVTLEAAHFGVPMVIFYRTSRLLGAMHATLGRWVVRTSSFSLINILNRRRIVPELMPWHGSADRLAESAIEMMSDPGCLLETRRNLMELVKPLRVTPPQTASDNAADLIVRTLREHANQRSATRELPGLQPLENTSIAKRQAVRLAVSPHC